MIEIAGAFISLILLLLPRLFKAVDNKRAKTGGQDEFDRALAANDLELASINLRGLSDRGKSILRLRERAIRRRAEPRPSGDQQATVEGASLGSRDMRDPADLPDHVAADNG